MGQYAEDIIDNECDFMGDYTHKYNNNAVKSKLSHAEKCIKAVRKELAILIQSKLNSNDINPVNNARKEINLKYGRNWRERGFISNSDNQWKPLSEYQ